MATYLLAEETTSTTILFRVTFVDLRNESDTRFQLFRYVPRTCVSDFVPVFFVQSHSTIRTVRVGWCEVCEVLQVTQARLGVAGLQYKLPRRSGEV